jgi:hypothetical protein
MKITIPTQPIKIHEPRELSQEEIDNYLEKKARAKKYHSAYYKKHKKVMDKRVNEWRKNNYDKSKAMANRYYKNNREKCLESMKNYRLKKKEEAQ